MGSFIYKIIENIKGKSIIRWSNSLNLTTKLRKYEIWNQLKTLLKQKLKSVMCFTLYGKLKFDLKIIKSIIIIIIS